MRREVLSRCAGQTRGSSDAMPAKERRRRRSWHLRREPPSRWRFWMGASRSGRRGRRARRVRARRRVPGCRSLLVPPELVRPRRRRRALPSRGRAHRGARARRGAWRVLAAADLSRHPAARATSAAAWSARGMRWWRAWATSSWRSRPPGGLARARRRGGRRGASSTTRAYDGLARARRDAARARRRARARVCAETPRRPISTDPPRRPGASGRPSQLLEESAVLFGRTVPTATALPPRRRGAAPRPSSTRARSAGSGFGGATRAARRRVPFGVDTHERTNSNTPRATATRPARFTAAGGEAASLVARAGAEGVCRNTGTDRVGCWRARRLRGRGAPRRRRRSRPAVPGAPTRARAT